MSAASSGGRIRVSAQFCPRNPSNRGQQINRPISRIGVGILARPESRESASRLSRLFLFWRGTPPQNRSDSRAASEYSAHVIETMTSANGAFTFTAHRRACQWSVEPALFIDNECVKIASTLPHGFIISPLASKYP